jgi:hypothetical protein
MTKRGKVLRDTNAGPGLLMVEGQQYQFSLEGVWRSELAPKPGLTVDVEFDPSGKITGITAVNESQLAKEQAGVALNAAKDQGKKVFDKAVAAVGLVNLIGGLLLLVSWTFLTAVSMQIPIIGEKLEFTFWQILGFLNGSNAMEMMQRGGHPSAGIYGFFAIVCLAGPFVYAFWKDKRAHLLGALPLVFMVIVAIMIRSSISSAMGPAVSGPMAEFQKQATDEIMKAFSYGIGMYLSGLISLYFAGMGVKNFLASKTIDAGTYQKAPKLAA